MWLKSIYETNILIGYNGYDISNNFCLCLDSVARNPHVLRILYGNSTKKKWENDWLNCKDYSLELDSIYALKLTNWGKYHEVR